MNDWKRVLKALERQGWASRTTGSGHLLARSPDGKAMVCLPATPSDHRSYRNALALLRRAGFQWPVS